MSHKSSQAFVSTASEAVISENGELERHILNFETVISAQNSSEDESTAVNDEKLGSSGSSINILSDSNIHQPIRKLTPKPTFQFSIDEKKELNETRSAKQNWLVGFVIVTAAIILVIILFPSFTSLKYPSRNTHIADSSNNTNAVLLANLERVANLIITEKNWSQDHIDLFISDWTKLDSSSQSLAKQSAWFQHISYLLENKVFSRFQPGLSLKDNSTEADESMLVLAEMLGIENLEKRRTELELRKRKFQQMIAEYSPQTKQNQLPKNQNISDDMISVQKTQPVKAKTPNVTAHVSEIENGVNSAVVEANLNIGQNIMPQPDPAVTGKQVDSLLERYQLAYEKGSTQDLLNLFVNDTDNSNSRMIKLLKENFESVFSRSASRSVRFSGINWRSMGDRAEISGDYHASLTLAGNKGVQDINAKVSMKVALLSDHAKIEELEIIRPSVKVKTPELGKHHNDKRDEVQAVSPSNAELQTIIDKFVSAYNAGDIEKLEALFASDAKTNSQSNISGIKQEYQQLFSQTERRDIKINNLSWISAESFAKGIGDLNAAITTAPGKQQAISLNGKIQIVAKKINDKVLITHLYHIEHDQ